jgi:hypothetical protein
MAVKVSRKIPRRTFLITTGVVTGTALLSAKFSFAASGPPDVLDHLLLGCSDLDQGIAFVEQHTGVRAEFGGVHPGRGTRNALLSLGQMHYLEIIAPDPQQTDAPDTYDLKKLTEPRLVGWAAHPGNLKQLAARLRSVNVAFEGPTPGSRKRPDGRLLQWQTLNLKDTHGGLLPFFIEWSPGTTHPSADAPKGCKFENFSISTTEETELQRLNSLMNLQLHIEPSANPQLRATISGRDGHTLQLTS